MTPKRTSHIYEAAARLCRATVTKELVLVVVRSAAKPSNEALAKSTDHCSCLQTATHTLAKLKLATGQLQYQHVLETTCVDHVNSPTPLA